MAILAAVERPEDPPTTAPAEKEAVALAEEAVEGTWTAPWTTIPSERVPANPVEGSVAVTRTSALS